MTQGEILVQKLIEKYGNEPGGPQRILEHPLFRALPLDLQVKLIHQYSPVFSRTNTSKVNSAATFAAKGAVLGGLAALSKQYIKPQEILKKVGDNPKMLVAAGVGAGALLGVLQGMKAFKSFNNTATLVGSGDSLGALVSRGGLPKSEFDPKNTSEVGDTLLWASTAGVPFLKEKARSGWDAGREAGMKHSKSK